MMEKVEDLYVTLLRKTDPTNDELAVIPRAEFEYIIHSPPLLTIGEVLIWVAIAAKIKPGETTTPPFTQEQIAKMVATQVYAAETAIKNLKSHRFLKGDYDKGFQIFSLDDFKH